jgi:putative transposase
MNSGQPLAPRVGPAAAGRVLGVSRASWYRSLQPVRSREMQPTPARALPPAERQRGLQHLHAERFRDQAPAQVYATLLEEGT